jgi:hypothetical protein
MGDPMRWRKWKPSGSGLPKPAPDSSEGGFVSSVSFVSSPGTQPASVAAQLPETASSPQAIENKQAAAGSSLGQSDKSPTAGGFGGFVSFVSRGTSPNEHAESRPISWAEWKARSLNRLSLEQGVSGRPGRITAATVRDGEQKEKEQLSK